VRINRGRKKRETPDKSGCLNVELEVFGALEVFEAGDVFRRTFPSS
jgi:hypothetical protein